MKSVVVAAGAIFFVGSLALAQTPDHWKAVEFLEGTFEAKSTGGTAGAAAGGLYTFRFELAHHVMARHSKSATGCKGPETFDCDHNDLLYIYQDAPGQPLRAIYFDNEGHVIHYAVSSPAEGTVAFVSDRGRPGPQFRLLYERKGSMMSGKFQMRVRSQAEWKSYLEWTGSKQ